MNHKFIFYDGLVFIKKNPQIIYSLVLIVLIPVLFFTSTALILNIVNQQLDRDIQQNSIALAKTIENFVKDDLNSPQAVQQKILNLKNISDYLKDIAIFTPGSQVGTYKAIASLDLASIGKEIQSINNSLAWQNKQTIATLRQDRSTKEKYWLSSSPVLNKDNQVIGIVSIAFSRAEADSVIAYLGRNLYLFSALFSLILILFVSNHARLFQYAILLMKLRELDRLKDEFISTVSHELRTPLTTIRGYLSLIQEGSYGPLSEKIKGGIDIVMMEVKRLYELVEDLLEVSRIEQQRISIEKAPLILNDFLKQISEELSVKAKEKSLNLIFVDYPQKLQINTDASRLKQIIVNLIGNSIKYTPSGTVEVGLLNEPKGFISIYVKDTGIGISAQDQQKLFTKFFRVQSEETAKITGTGLGLWITKKLVELLGGQIFLESIKGQGSKFTVIFPYNSNQS
jgi:signal transduction histidine kinase